MTNADVLIKALEKAGTHWLPRHKQPLDEYVELLLEDDAFYPIIFSHDFAKAFWGDDRVDEAGFRTICGPKERWQYHLQVMVIDPNPIQYLAKFL